MTAVRRTKNKPARRHTRNQLPKLSEPQTLPFIAHVYELRRRLFFIALAVIIFGGLAYVVNKPITQLLLSPAGNQQFIYTTPGGGFDFLFKLCFYTGIAASIPVIVYQVLRYLQPLIQKDALRFIVRGSIVSALLAIVGISFGYLVGLPAAMHFLLQGFSSEQITALINIQSYLSFVMLYLLGSALLFQVPLIMVLINRIKPLRPGKLMRFQRWFIVFAFIAGAVINPSPNVQDQLLLTIPMILMYQVGVGLVWAFNRRRQRPKKIQNLLRKDGEVQTVRQEKFAAAQAAWQQLVADAAGPAAAQPQAAPMPEAQRSAQVKRPQQYVQEFRRPPRRHIVIQQTQPEQ